MITTHVQDDKPGIFGYLLKPKNSLSNCTSKEWNQSLIKLYFHSNNNDK